MTVTADLTDLVVDTKITLYIITR